MSHAKSIELAWIIVKDLKEAVKFYTEVVGLKLFEMNEEYHWAELEGQDGGTKLGIAQMEEGALKPGCNAIVTFSVADIEKTMKEVQSKGAICEGGIQDVPGHVRMLTVIDQSGNRFQFVQKLECCSHHC